MGKKKRLNLIKKLCNDLPQISENTHEKHLLKGSEILEWGTVKEIDGVAINPDKEYLYSYPVILIQNNARRLKRAFVKNGINGLKHQLGNITNIVQHNISNTNATRL